VKYVWKIEIFDGLELKEAYSAPGNLTPKEIARIMKQIVSRHLTPHEIIRANLRKRMKDKTNLLEICDRDGILEVGENPHIVARKVEYQA